MFGVCLSLCLCFLAGCSMISRFGSDPSGEEYGKTFYLGGAGPIGRVGSFDVPNGLRDGGYRGAIEVFDWQSLTLVDQIDRDRNEDQARELARRIQDYLDRYPNRRVNLIALSAGTGISTWALEQLPAKYRVGTVVFLGSSLSRRYDLCLSLRRLDGRLYNFYSSDDPILKYGVPISGSVDREFDGGRVGGLLGFAFPEGIMPPGRALYAERLRNMPWRRAYARYGYSGRHTDSVRRAFVARYVAPLLLEPVSPPPRAEPGETLEEPPLEPMRDLDQEKDLKQEPEKDLRQEPAPEPEPEPNMEPAEEPPAEDW